MTLLNTNATDTNHKTQVETGVSHSRRIVDSTVETSKPAFNNESSTHDEPIIGYAQEPLLPLINACEPLSHIIHNIEHYAHTALSRTPQLPPNGLTIDESAAIRLYTMEWQQPHQSLYTMLNYTLKNQDRQHLRPYF
ncbi:unnamed protein product, partial [Adineta ricciae]